jgi:diguanylate cyclase (GGDEF)-like protein
VTAHRSTSAAQVVGAAAARLGSAPDLAGTLQGIAAAARTALGADRATCYANEVETQVVSAVYTTEDDPKRRAFLERTVGQGADALPIWRLHLAQEDPLLAIEDVQSHPAVPRELAERLRSGAFIGVRLEHLSVRADGAPALLGTLFCSYGSPRRFSAAERQAARGLANLAAMALANARLQAETAQSLEENRSLAAEQAALRRVATQVAAEGPPEAVFAQAAEEVAGLLGVDCGLVARFDSDSAVPVGWWSAQGGPLEVESFPLDGEGALAQVARTGRVARVRDYAPLAQTRDPVGRIARGGGYRSGVAVPVHVGGLLWGGLLAASTGEAPVSAAAEARLERFAELVALAIGNAEARARLAAQAASDPLTGLANHRTFFERLNAETGRARRHGASVGLVLIDLDHFKRVNDHHGHQVGDRVLLEAAGRLGALAREEDTLARIGGEEFAWLLPETGAQAAWEAAERARSAIAAEPFPVAGKVTMSAGVAELGPDGTVNELFRAADAALYWAKSQGRDACVPYTPEHQEAFAARAPGAATRLTPTVERLLALVREQIGLAVAAVGEFDEGTAILRHLVGDAAAFGLHAGQEVPLEQTYCHLVARGRLPNLVRDTRRDERVRDLPVTATMNIGAYLGVPITLPGGRHYGTLFCLSPRAEPALGERDVRQLRIVAGMLGEELKREEYAGSARRNRQQRIRRVLDGEGLSVVLQPIVDLNGGRVVFAEALSRFGDEPYRSPDVWFAEAADLGLGVELELAAVRAALAHADALPPGVRLSLNVSPEALCAPELAELLAAVPGQRLALELTEHAPVDDYATLEPALEAQRRRGVLLKIDDAGAGFSTLKHVLRLRPDVIKLDLSLSRDIDTDPVRRALAASLVAFAREIDAGIVAEGIETRAELEALRALGVTMGQGYYLARPGDGPVPGRVALAPVEAPERPAVRRDAARA